MLAPIVLRLAQWLESSQPLERQQRHNEQARITADLYPGRVGRVWFQSTEWYAVCPYHVVLLAETPVRVIDRQNATTLVVVPVLLMTMTALKIEQRDLRP